MKVCFRDFKSIDENEEVFSASIKPKNVKADIVTRPKPGLHIRKYKYTCEIVFDFSACLSGHQQGFISFTEGEILQLAKLCRRGRGDEEFLRAIDRAGEPKAKKAR